MKRAMCVSLICCPLLISAALADDRQEPSEPATKLEAFQARTGVVVVRGFTKVGTIVGMGSIAVGACDFKIANDPSVRSSGVKFEVKEASRLERESTAFIDSDEIDSLLTGIDYIAKSSSAVTTQNNFEVEYRTKGDLRIVVFNDSSGRLSAGVSVGRIGRTTAYLSVDQLQQLRRLIVAAKERATGKTTGKVKGLPGGDPFQ